jgi:hypothetical protein
VTQQKILRLEKLRINGSAWVVISTHMPLICGRQLTDPYHLRFVQSRALGRNVCDEFTIPLCRGHHREVRRCSDEMAWWRNVGVDSTVATRELWIETHPLATIKLGSGT